MRGRGSWIAHANVARTLVVLSTIALILPGCGESADRASTEDRAVPMDEARFWKIVEPLRALPCEGREDRLRRDLGRLEPAEIQAFAQHYRHAMNRAYTWELWGAGYVIMQGCSDDGFKEFRNWLISEGRAAYEAVLAEPDRLAEITKVPVSAAEPELGDWPMLAELDLIPLDLLGAFDSADPMDLERLDEIEAGWEASPAEPTGTAWDESDGVLAARYPRLWKRYGPDGERRRAR